MNKRKKILICSLISLLIFIFFIIVYIKTDLFKTKEMLFWKYFLSEKDEITNVLSNDETTKFNDKLKMSSYIKEGSISITSKFKLIKPININIKEIGNKGEDHKNILIDLKYNNKDVTKTIIAKEDDYYLINNNLLSDDYIGFKNDNLKQLAQKFGIANTDLIPNKIKDVDYSELFSLEKGEMRHILWKYIPICRKYVKNKHYIKETNILIDDKKMNLYKLELTEKQINELAIDLLKQLSNDERTLGIISNKAKTLDEMNRYSNIENIKSDINKLIDYLNSKEVTDNIFLTIIIYKSENGVEKVEFLLNNDRTISIQTDKNNTIIIKQYDIKYNKNENGALEGILKTILNSITEVTYKKEILNDKTNRVDFNIQCKFGIESINIDYNYVERMENNVEYVVKKDNIQYLDLNDATKETCKSILEKVLKINVPGIGKNYLKKN